MKHELLKNNVYLTLLAFYNNKTMPTYVELGKISGITRQTAAKKVKELIDNNIIKVNTNNILSVDNNMELDVDILKDLLDKNPNITAVELENIFFGDKDKYVIMEELDMS
jgi:predicted transcriptional regulator